MPAIQGSPPFSLSAHDWKKLGIGAILATLGGFAAFLTAEALPTLEKHVNNDVGALLVALAATALPIVANAVRKLLTDTTTVVKLLLFAAVLAVPGVASAGDYSGATAVVANSTMLQNLFNDPLLMAAILLGGCLLASKVFKIDLSAFIVPIINSLLKPPSTTPSPPSTPTTPGPVVPSDPSAWLKFLLDMLLKAKANGDKEQEAAAMKLLEDLRRS